MGNAADSPIEPEDGTGDFDELECLMRVAFGPRVEDAGAPCPSSDDVAVIRLPTRYRPIGEIGRGGVGIVFEAEDQVLGRRVAVKVMQARHVRSAALRSKFESEGRIGAQLQHPGILGVLDVGRTNDDQPFFTMRLVPAEPLATRLALRDPADPQLLRWLPVFARVCEAVAYAHARGVVHRDLKPGNVLIGAFGEVLVTDWGMAKVLEHRADDTEASLAGPVMPTPDGRSMSVTGSLWGTPAYMAPEQARGEIGAATPRADVFGLGSLLCELLTGAPPFTGTPEVVLVQARLGDLADATSRLERCGGADDLVALARRCLAVDPADRPRDAMQVAEAVQRHVDSVQERAHVAALQAAAAEARAAADRRLRRTQAAWFVAVLVLILVSAGLWMLWQQHTEARAASDARAVERALDEGRARWRDAIQSGDDADWRLVMGAAETAVTLATASDVASDLKKRARAFANDAAVETRAAAQLADERAADAVLRQRLDELHSRQWFDHDLRVREAGYAAVFAELGMDPTAAPPATVAAAVRGHRLVDELAVALSRWASVCRQVECPPERIAAVRAVARAVDSDPLRLRLRDLIAQPDAAAVRELFSTTELRTVPVASVLLMFDAAVAAADGDLAQEVLEHGQLEHPTDFGLASLLAQECGARSDAVGETRYASVALALRPDALHAGTRLAANLSFSGRPAQSELLFRRIAERHTHEPSLWFNVGAALEHQGRYAEAIDALRRAEEAGEQPMKSAILLGRSARGLRRFGEAREWYELATRREPSAPDPWVRLGAMLCDDLRDFEGALAAFDRALQLAPDTEAVQRNRAVVLEKMGRSDEALVQWQRLAQANPRLAEPHFKLALAAFRAGRHQDLIGHASEAVRLSPQLADAWFMLGTALDELAEPHAAKTSMRCAVRADPNHASAWHNLGWMLTEDPATRGEAIDALRRAVAIAPEMATGHYSLAYALYLDGDFDGCRQAVDAALRLAPEMPEARDLRARLENR